MFFLNLGSRIFDRNPPKLYSIVLTLTPLNSYYNTLQNLSFNFHFNGSFSEMGYYSSKSRKYRILTKTLKSYLQKLRFFR